MEHQRVVGLLTMLVAVKPEVLLGVDEGVGLGVRHWHHSDLCGSTRGQCGAQPVQHIEDVDACQEFTRTGAEKITNRLEGFADGLVARANPAISLEADTGCTDLGEVDVDAIHGGLECQQFSCGLGPCFGAITNV